MARDVVERAADLHFHHVHATILPLQFEPRPGDREPGGVGNGEEHDVPDRRSMGQQHHSDVLVGVSLRSNAVRAGYGYSLAADEVQAVVPHQFCDDAVVADGDCGGDDDSDYLSVYHGGYAAVYIFPVLVC